MKKKNIIILFILNSRRKTMRWIILQQLLNFKINLKSLILARLYKERNSKSLHRTRVLLPSPPFQISEQAWKRDSTTLLPPTPENCHRRSESDVTKPSALATLLVLVFSPLIPLSLGSLSLSLKLDFSCIHFTRFEFYTHFAFKLHRSCMWYIICTSKLPIRNSVWIFG